MNNFKKIFLISIFLTGCIGVTNADYNVTYDNPIGTDIGLTNSYIIIDLGEPSDEQYCIELNGTLLSSVSTPLAGGFTDEYNGYSYGGAMLGWTPGVFLGGDTFFSSITCTFAGTPSASTIAPALIVTSTGVTVTQDGLNLLTTSSGGYLSTIFQIIQLLPTIAIISGGFYILNRMFAIIP